MTPMLRRSCAVLFEFRVHRNVIIIIKTARRLIHFVNMRAMYSIWFVFDSNSFPQQRRFRITNTSWLCARERIQVGFVYSLSLRNHRFDFDVIQIRHLIPFVSFNQFFFVVQRAKHTALTMASSITSFNL